MSIYRGAGGAGDATNNATSQAILAAESAQQAAASAAAASASASQAAASATNSASSATSSANSATAAASSANSASTSATNAANSATTAQTAQTAAELAETNAETAEANAETAEANATASASLAQDWATKTSGPVAGGEYSSKYNAQLAATSATNAANSATSASTSASAASTSATNAASSATAAASSVSTASTSATNAANSATAAATSATSAASSASTATTQASNAASSATAAATSASNAATSETNAANSASASATSATNASNSASAASTSATNAANSATAAAASYDSFDDRYLGSKTSNPTLDNDGNALLTGALYWNSTVGEMRVYNGSTWVAAYVSAATYVAKAGDVMTGSLEVPTQASLKATALTRASIRPSLLLDFANTKQLDPRITFSRPTTATYYDGKTVVKAEENLLTYSQSLTVGVWNPGNVSITANTTTSPDGTSTASTMTGDGVSTAHRVTCGYSVTSVGVTVSIYAKAGSAQFIQLHIGGDANPYANFDLSGGTVGSVGTNQTASIIAVGNGWYRCVMTTPSTAGTFAAVCLVTSSSAARLETNTLSTSVYLWGAQVENRLTVTAYTPTTTAPITNYIPALQTAAAGVPRFDHDPVTGESKGLLIEEQRTNLLTYSDDFSNAVWFKGTGSSVSSNTHISPEGSLNADTIAANADVSVYQSVGTVTLGASYCHSAYIKAGTATAVMIRDDTGAGRHIVVNPFTGAITTTSGTLLGYGVQNVGNGWYRYWFSFTTDSTNARLNVRPTSAGTSQTIIVWGAQLEAGSFPTSYIPTVASQVTRSADAASMTGSNFSSWYRADEGSFYADYAVSVVGSAAIQQSLFTVSDATSNNVISFYKRANADTSTRFSVISNGVGTSFINSGTFLSQNKVAGVYKVNDFASTIGGGTISTDTDGAVAINQIRLEIGSYVGATYFLNGTIKRIAYYPKRLSNAELQGITS